MKTIFTSEWCENALSLMRRMGQQVYSSLNKSKRKTNMILSTTPAIEGHTIREYKGVVFGEVITGVNFLKDFAASIRNFVGGRSGSYENELVQARQNAMEEMAQRARSMGANAVVGIDIDYEVLGADNGMLMVTASGTAVIID